MIREIVMQHKAERDKLLDANYQPRLLNDNIESYLSSKPIKLITGPRRAGKSTFALLMLKGK